MKQYLLLLTLLLSLLHVAVAKPRVPLTPSQRVQLGQYTHYLAVTLQLSAAQEQAVRQLAFRHTLGEASAASRAAFEQDLVRVLTPGQYNAYAWLAEGQFRQ